MGWLSRLTHLSALCLLFVNGSRAQAPDEVPAQPLPQALAAFALSNHLQLVYVSQLAYGKTSRSVPAGLSPAISLARLLEGTGLDFQFLNDHTIKLFEPSRAARVLAPASTGEGKGEKPSVADSLDEVVVSATKRDEVLSAVPMSITVLLPEELAASGMQGIGGIAVMSTGIEYDFSSQYGPGILSNIAVRGITAEKGDATTGIYLDDIPIQTPHTTFGNAYPVTFDLARVEVLRGPQGVLFGRGAEGGAIRFVTNEPSTTTVSHLYHSEISATDHGGSNVEFGAATGGPVVEGILGGRISVWYRHDGGYVDRIDPFTETVVDADANRSASRALRVSMLYQPSESVSVTPSLSHQSIDLHDTPVFYAEPAPNPGSLQSGKLLRQPAVDDLTIGSLSVVDRTNGVNLTAITSFVDRSAKATVDTTNVAGVAFFNGYGNPLGPAFPASYADAIPTQLTLRQILFSQEVRLASRDSAAPLKWLGGIFYSRLRQDSTQDTYAIATPTNPGILTDDYNVITEASVFGQMQWSLDAHWNIGAGVRTGWLGSRSTTWASGFADPRAASAHGSNQETLPPAPRFDLTYQPGSRNLFYAAVAKGFRAGGKNGNRPELCANSLEPGIFRSDSVWSYEVGAKNQLFDRRLHIDVSLFDIHWNGIQEHVQDLCGNSFTANAGTARSSGFDLGSEALITRRWRVAAAVGYLDVHYTRTLSAPDGQLIVARGTVVGGVPSVPAPWSGTLSSRYEWPVAATMVAYLRAEEIMHSHNSGPFTELLAQSASYDPRLTADPALYLLNLQLGVSSPGLNVRLFVNNAANAHPRLQRFTDAPGSALVYAYTFQPRTVGVMGTWAF